MPVERPAGARAPGRGAWGIVLVLCALWLGFVAGTMIGVRFFVPAGSGLAGPAIALGYGAIGAVAGGVLAVVIAWTQTAGAVRAVALASAVLTLLSLAGFGVRVLRVWQDGGGAASAVQAPASTLRVTAWIDEQADTRAFRELELDGATWESRWISPGPAAQTCTVALTGAEAAAVHQHLGYLESRVNDAPPLCLGDTEAPWYRLRWTPRAGAETVTVESGQACLTNEPAWARIWTTLGRIPLDAIGNARASCR